VIDIDRATALDPAGSFVRILPYRPPSPVARLGDGRFLETGFAAGTNPFELGQSRPKMALIHIGPADAARIPSRSFPETRSVAGTFRRASSRVTRPSA